MSPQHLLLNPGDLDKHRAQPDAAITAGSWNALRNAILAAYTQADALATQPGYITVTVRERATDALAPASSIASIQAQPEGEADSQIPVTRLGGRFFVGLLDPGVYRVAVTPTQASGYAAQARTVAVRSGQPAELTFFLAPPAPGKTTVPRLFGRTLQEALNQLTAAELRPGRVVDSHGLAVAVTLAEYLGGYLAPDPLQAAATVVGSEPGEAMEVDASSAVNLVIAAQRTIPPAQRVVLDLTLPGEALQDNLDPLLAATGVERMVAAHLFEGLVAARPDDEIVDPGLAGRWARVEGEPAWTFFLRPGLGWVRLDQRAGLVESLPLTATDVVFSLQRLIETPPGETENRPPVSSVEAIDESTVRIRLDGEDEAQLLAWLALPITFPVPKALLDDLGGAWTKPDSFVSSGPFVLAEFTPDRILLRKNDFWHGADRLRIDDVRLLRVDEERAVLAYLAGDLDSTPVPQSMLERVSQDPSLAGQIHLAGQAATWLTRPWLTRSYSTDPQALPLAQIHTWQLDWAAKRQAIRP